ncbi:protein CapI [archaeon]|nr:protein CapI [archaeon]|tara:strand:+ start:809 stop:1753 length:945 start_codon:yes stop_codon:yes gene_type:complete
MKVLVTGGAGFIGFHVAKALLARGDEVVIVDKLSDYYDVELKKGRLNMLEGVTFYQVDISDKESMEKIFSEHKFDRICHLAAQAGVRYSLENPYEYEKTNNLGTLTIFECMKKFGVEKIVFASSSSVYGGNTKIPFCADDRVDTPISLYAATKKYNELMAHVYYKLFGIQSIGLRFFTVYGPWGRPDLSLYKFTKLMLEGKPIDVYNHGDHRRDFTYITDIVRGILLSLEKVNDCDVLNLGCGNTVTLMKFIELIEKELGIVAQKNMLPMQKGDVHTTFADVKKTKEVLGWEPEVSVEEGIKHFVSWYKEYVNK